MVQVFFQMFADTWNWFDILAQLIENAIEDSCLSCSANRFHSKFTNHAVINVTRILCFETCEHKQNAKNSTNKLSARLVSGTIYHDYDVINIFISVLRLVFSDVNWYLSVWTQIRSKESENNWVSSENFENRLFSDAHEKCSWFKLEFKTSVILFRLKTEQSAIYQHKKYTSR